MDHLLSKERQVLFSFEWRHSKEEIIENWIITKEEDEKKRSGKDLSESRKTKKIKSESRIRKEERMEDA